MTRLWILGALLLALAGAANANTLTGYACQGWGLTALTGPAICGTAPAPPICSNSLDFSAACNSQYIPLL